MRKANLWNRLLSLALCLCMVLSLMPAIAPPVEVMAADATSSKPIYEVAIYPSSLGKETPQRELEGMNYTFIDFDLNKGCGEDTDYIYMGYRTFGVSKPITGIFFRTGENPPESATFEGVTAYLLGGENEENSGWRNPVDLNQGAKGEYIYMYITRDPSRPVITDITIDNNSSKSGYVTPNMDLNAGAGGDYIYLHYKQFTPVTVSATYYYLNADGSRNSASYSATLNGPNQALKTAPSCPSTVSYGGNTYTFKGWREDNTAAEPSTTAPSATPNTGSKTYRAVYSYTAGLSYNSNGGSSTGIYQTGFVYLNAGSSSVSKADAAIVVSSKTSTHPTKCNFLGWSTNKAATSATYTGGSTIYINKATTLYAVFAQHTPGADDGDHTTAVNCTKCGKVAIAATGHTEEPVAGKAPTCTEPGLTDGVKCSICGKPLTAQLEIPALGHSWTDATCTKLAVCKVCGMQNGSLAADNHADNTNTKITDNGNGTHSLICSECDAAITTEAHKGGEATCTEKAVCETCGEAYGELLDHKVNASGVCIQCGAVLPFCVNEAEKYFATINDACAYAVSNMSNYTITVMADAQVDRAAVDKLVINPGVTLTVNNELTVSGLKKDGNLAGNGFVIVGETKYKIFDNDLYLYAGAADENWEIWNVEFPTYWTAGEGYVAFNPNTSVLTLHNATIYAESDSSDDAGVVYKQDLTINFSGTNTLTTNDHNGGTMLYCEGKTVMNGIGQDAVLNIYSGYRSNDNDYEVRAVSLSNLMVNSGTLNVVSGNGFSTIALSATTITVAEGAVVNANAGNGLGGHSMGVMAQKLTVEGTLNATSGSCGSGVEAAFSSDVVVLGTPVAGNGTINGLCMVVDENMTKIDYIVYGNTTLKHNRILQVVDGVTSTFTVPEGTTLTIAEDVTLDLSVATEIDFSGTVVNNGTIILPASYDINNAPKSGTVVIGGNRFIWNGQKWGCADESQHTGGQATCSKIAICELCGETYGDYDYYNHAGETYVEFEWYPYDDGTCYVNATLYCADCDGYIDSNSDYAEQTGTVEPTDCLNPGSVTYSITLTLNEQEYTETKTYTILSENHVGEPVNGFCSACGGYEAAVWNEEKSVYEISNAGQLYWYAQYLNTQNAEIYAELTADIIIPENAPNWEPINASYAYFNGNYHTISGLKCIGGDMTYVGMFGLEGWWYEISNLHITDSYFEGKEYVGAVVACMSNGGSVTNCAVTNTTVKGDDYKVGGLVGYLGVSHAINCYSTATVVGESGNVLVGYYSSGYGSIENCYYLSETETEDGGKTAEQFASGEVAFLLQSGITEDGYYDENDEWVSYIPEIWGQSIGEDAYPELKGEKVYEGYVHCDVPGYTNNPDSKAEPHSYIDGICDVCDHVCTHDTIADGKCSECGLKMYTVSVDNDKLSYGIEVVEGAYAFEGKDYTGKLTLSRRYAPSSDFRFIITIGGVPTTNYSLVAGVLTIPGESVTGDIVITCEGELIRIDTEIDCFDYCAGALSPYTVEWAEDYSSATFTYTCAFCDEVLSKTVGVSSEVISEPTCSEEGVVRYSAAYGDFQATKDVPTEKNPDAHTWLDATCTAPKTCLGCGAQEGDVDLDNHSSTDYTYKYYLNRDFNRHEKFHACCGVSAGMENHSYNEQTGLCNECGAEILIIVEMINAPTEYLTHVEYALRRGGRSATLLKNYTNTKSYTVAVDALYFAEGVTLTNNGTLVMPEHFDLSTLVNNYSGTGIVTIGDASYVWNGEKFICAGDHTPGNDGFCVLCGERATYDIWVQDIQVTVGNAADVLGNLDEGATVTYDAATNTLYLNNATIGGAAQGIHVNGDLNLHITGNNSITTVEGESATHGIYANGGVLTIDGTGSLHIQSAAAVNASYGIVADFGLHIKGGSVTAIAGNAALSIGVKTAISRIVTVDSGATLTASGNPNGSFFGSGINAKTVTGEGTINAIAILMPNADVNDFTEHLVVYGNATLEEDAPSVGFYQVMEGAVLTIAEGVMLDMSNVTADKIILSGTIVNNGTVALPDSYTYATIPTAITGGTVTIGESSYIWNGEKYICGNHSDTDNSGRCDSCGMLMQPAKICFATASLEGNIAINFYTLLSDQVAADPDAYMLFTMANDTEIKVYVRDAVSGEVNGETYYVFTCAVNAKEMADDVRCRIFYEGGSTAEVTYNVKAYGNYIVNNSDDASAKALAQAMLNYGAASQIHFGYHTDNLANSEVATPDYSSVTISGFNAVAGQGTDLAKLYSASLILKSETTLRFFFKVDSSVENFTVTCNGQELEVKERGGLYYVDVVGIAAKDLDKAVTLTINDGTTTAEVSFNPMSYCQGVLNDNSGAFDQEMKDLVVALYLYNQAANKYFMEG